MLCSFLLQGYGPAFNDDFWALGVLLCQLILGTECTCVSDVS